MRTFYSPAERRLLASLPKHEAEIAEALMQTFDAHLIEEHDDAGDQPALFEAA